MKKRGKSFKNKSRYIVSDTRKKLLIRSGGVCECCGAAGIPDHHHLKEYRLGGLNSVENLLVLCPSCHRQIPKYLTIDQQRQLQSWHTDNIGKGNISTTSQLRGLEASIDIGTVVFKLVKTVLKYRDQNIITVHHEDSGFFVNIVMLEKFNPKLMVLSNRVIVNDSYTFITSREEVLVQDPNGDTNFRITAGPILTFRGQVTLDGELLSFTEEGLKFRGINTRYMQIECENDDRAALDIKDKGVDINFGGATIKVVG